MLKKTIQQIIKLNEEKHSYLLEKNKIEKIMEIPYFNKSDLKEIYNDSLQKQLENNAKKILKIHHNMRQTIDQYKNDKSYKLLSLFVEAIISNGDIIYKINKSNEESEITIFSEHKTKNDKIIEVVMQFAYKFVTMDEAARRITLIMNDVSTKFNNLEEHLKYLHDKRIYNVEHEHDGIKICQINNNSECITIYKPNLLSNIFYHGTSIDVAAKIIKDGYIKPSKYIDVNWRTFNKVFFTQKLNHSKDYGRIGGMVNSDLYLKYVNKIYVILEVDLSNYPVYMWEDEDEYIVWGNVSTDSIQAVWVYN